MIESNTNAHAEECRENPTKTDRILAAAAVETESVDTAIERVRLQIRDVIGFEPILSISRNAWDSPHKTHVEWLWVIHAMFSSPLPDIRMEREFLDDIAVDVLRTYRVNVRTVEARARFERESRELEAADAATKHERKPVTGGPTNDATTDMLPLVKLGPGGDFTTEIRP